MMAGSSSSVLSSIVRWTLALWLGVLAGCASLPDVSYLRDGRIAIPREPTIVGAKGELSDSRKQAILDRLATKAGPTEIIDRHIAAEEAITGTPLVAGNQVTLLADGPITMRAMMNAVRTARNHVNLETYIIDDDDTGRQLANLMIDRRRAGVQVNLIYDSVGSLKTAPAFFDRLRAAGVNVLEYNPINPAKARGDWQINQRDHRKLLIVDGRIAFTGGVNISEAYGRSSFLHTHSSEVKADKNKAAWRDTHMEIEGPAVAEFQKMFLDTWQRQTGKELTGAEYFPPQQTMGNALVRPLGSVAERADYTIYKTYISALSNATQYVHLTNAYFIPDQQIVDAIKEAAQRGVDVRIIFPSLTDHKAILYASRSYYDELMQAGVKVYERRIAMLHAKTAVIDGVWSTIGSTNLDMRSFLHNDEINAVVLSTEFADKMEALFQRDLQDSVEITPQAWHERGVAERLHEWAIRLLEYWL